MYLVVTFVVCLMPHIHINLKKVNCIFLMQGIICTVLHSAIQNGPIATQNGPIATQMQTCEAVSCNKNKGFPTILP